MNVHPRMLTIGALAKAAEVSTPTIRYYEEIELLPPADRTGSGQRVYGEPDIERLTFIRRCRDFGFSIDQVRVLSGLSISADQDCSQVRNVAFAHLKKVRAKLDELRALATNLERFVEQCDISCSGGPGRDCVVFRDLGKPGAECCS